MATACFIPNNWNFSYPETHRLIIDNSIQKKVGLTLATTKIEESTQNTLFRELDKVYEEYKNDNWDYEDALGISSKSVKQARDFVFNFNDIPVPYVVPYANGKIGIRWSHKGKYAITILFNGDNTYTYSTIEQSKQGYGTEEQTLANQAQFMKRIIGILKSV